MALLFLTRAAIVNVTSAQAVCDA